MKSTLLYTAASLLLPSFLFAQGGLVNNGAALKVASGASIRVNNGGITNKNSGAINNSGNVHLDGNYDQTVSASYNGNVASWLWFGGSGNQTIIAADVARIRVDNGNDLQLLAPLNISTDIDLMNNSSILLGNFNLTANAATISNYGVNAYIKTNGNGVLEQSLNNGDNKVFPVGNAAYNPATINHSGTADNFQVRVTDAVLQDGTTGTPLAQDVVNTSWFITETTMGGSNSSVSLEWDQSQELPSFARTATGLARWNGSDWVALGMLAAATPAGGTRWSQSIAGQTAFSLFALEDNNRILSTLPTVGTTATDLSCHSSCDGTITTTATNGTAPYTYLWSNGATDANLTGLCAGSYTVTVTDAFGATVATTQAVASPAALALSLSPMNTSCFGLCDGVANTASITGGTAPYSYLWSNGVMVDNITGLCAGNYTLTVTDANNCTISQATIVGSPLQISLSFSSTGESCSGNDGSATVNVTNGVAPFNYAWSDGQMASTALGLVAGNYAVTVTDVNGCQQSGSTMVDNDCFSMTLNSTHVTCRNACNGTATPVLTGGVAPFIYAWSNGASTPALTGLCPATYRVTVTDNAGFSTTATATITQPATAVAATISKTNMHCYGVPDGTATVVASGGTPGYTYQWNNGQTTASAMGLAQASHVVTVSDANGCTIQKTALVISPSVIIITLASRTGTTCVGDNGSATVSATGGTGAKTFAWSNGATGATATGLAAGSYTVTATDANGCQQTTTVMITNDCIMTVNKTDLACNSVCTGTASVVVNGGGTAPYTYKWSNNAGGATTPSISGLCAGNYYVTVTDARGAVNIGLAAITQPAVLTASISKTNATCSGACNGTATVIASGAAAPYTYQWSSGGTSNSVSGLCQGTYYVTVTSASGCSIVKSFLILQNVIVLTTNTTPSSCAIDGTASVAVSGTGVAPYTYLWSNGETTATITGLVSGNYKATVTDANGCVKISSFANVTNTCTMPVMPDNTTTNIAEEGMSGALSTTTNRLSVAASDDLLMVYPNPNTGLFYIKIELEEAQTATVRIQDVLGRTLHETQLEGQLFQLPVYAHEWANGAYFVQLLNKNGQQTIKMIVSK